MILLASFWPLEPRRGCCSPQQRHVLPPPQPTLPRLQPAPPRRWIGPTRHRESAPPPPGPALSIRNRLEDAPSNADQSGVVAGTVVDSENGEGVPFAYLHLEEINRTATTDRHGHYELSNVPNGTYTVVIHRIGHHSQSRTITIDEDRSDEITFTLTPAILSGEAVQVVADAESTTGSNLEHASVKISGEQLRQDRGTTLSSTLSNQPGFSERSMGAASGRPVIRGLGDERVLILEDGERTGDVSWTSGDHAVTVDPRSEERRVG